MRSQEDEVQYEAGKYSGCGNNFILVDDRKASRFPLLNSALIIRICQLASVDGFIVLHPPQNNTCNENNNPANTWKELPAEVRMEFFNCDGKRAEMCGNGVRCLFAFLLEMCGWDKPQLILETFDRKLRVSKSARQSTKKNHNNVVVNMGKALNIQWNISIPHPSASPPIVLSYLNTGVPHIVIFVQNIEECEVESIGRFLRYHPQFQPQGSNVNFIQRSSETHQYHAKVRTYERGVEAETQACGTGVTAAAFVLHQLHSVPFPIDICVKSEDILQVSENQEGDLLLDGPAECQNRYTLFLQHDQTKLVPKIQL